MKKISQTLLSSSIRNPLGKMSIVEYKKHRVGRTSENVQT